MLISFTFSHLFSAESRTGEAPSPLTECHAMFCLFLKRCSHQLQYLKSISIFRAISLPFVQPLQDRSFMYGKTIQTARLPYCHVLRHNSSFISKYCTLHSLLLISIL
jgi:hypothetical protein